MEQLHYPVQALTPILLDAQDFYCRRIAGWEEDGVRYVQFWYKLTEDFTGGTRTEEGHRTLPAAQVEPIIENYDIVTNQITIKPDLLSLFLQQFNLQLREETPEPDA